MIDLRTDLRNIETFYDATGNLSAYSILEEGLGLSLFNRDKRRVSLTNKGVEMLSYAENMLRLHQDMQVAMCSTRTMRGTLRLGVTEALASTWVPYLIKHLSELYPELAIDLRVDTSPSLKDQLISQQIELAFSMDMVDDLRIENLQLCEYPRSWVIGSEFKVDHKPVQQEYLSQWPIITYSPGSQHYKCVQGMIKKFDIKPPRIHCIGSLNMKTDMVRRNMGITFLSPASIGEYLARGELCLLDVEELMPPSMNFMAGWMRGPDSYKSNVVAQLGQQIAQDEHALTM